MATRRSSTWMVLGLATSSVGGCVIKETIDNPVHCANNSGDAFCAESYPDGSRPYCASGLGDCAERYVSGTQHYCHTNGACSEVYDGCMAMQPDEECWAQWGRDRPPGDESSGGSTSSGMSSSGSGETSATSMGSESGTGACVGHEDCEAAGAPVCVDGGCVPCEQGPAEACAARDPLARVCDAGECVQCTEEDATACEGATPICDGGLRHCVPCGEHSDCSGAACNLVEGSCFAPSEVIHVDGDGTRDFMTIGAALASVSAGASAVIIVHERNGGSPYTETVTIGGGRTIAMLAADGETPILQGPGIGSAVAVSGASTTAFLERLRLRNSGGLGLTCDGAHVDIRRSWVVQNDAGALRASNDCELHVESSFVGGDVNNTDAVVITGAAADFLYTTVVAGDGNLGENSRAVICDPVAIVSIRNAFLVAIDDAVPEVDCSSATISHTASENALPGDGNAALGDIQAGWFVDLANDFHLDSPPATVSTTARWQDGDPLVDIDGDPRPGVSGAADHVGADVP